MQHSIHENVNAMSTKNTASPANAATTKENNEQNSFFAVPESYKRGECDTLRQFYSGDWWLNVNYVEQVR
ncbi:hypothetical protein FHR99_001495 [Litorivivens lipolytica]|uniref:Uncharacterized protein n=1 Tax=Litorivivens lipolytica TaxID=1524264 RepID=A0A7W4W4H5_9GAMM|nr:hypothetical protein [Litorivivens lipolytica]MBB3047259.1 hypothetical protein [Litorivivens lipolytica]